MNRYSSFWLSLKPIEARNAAIIASYSPPESLPGDFLTFFSAAAISGFRSPKMPAGEGLGRIAERSLPEELFLSSNE